MGTEVYELADALLAELLESNERMRVLARYRSENAWDADSVSVVLQLIDDLHSSGRLPATSLQELRQEIASWSPRFDNDSTDELPGLSGIAIDDPTEELDDATDVTVILPQDMREQLGVTYDDEPAPLADKPVEEKLVAAVVPDANLPAIDAASSASGDEEARATVAVSAIESAADVPAQESSREPPAEPGLPPLEPGALLAGRYRFEQLLGAGGYCLVFRALDVRREALGAGDAHVAVKALRPELRDDERAIARLKREYRAVATLSHPGIVRVFDLDCDGGQWFFTLECLPGASLAARMRERVGRVLPVDEARTILDQCAAALDYAHSRGQVHGDVKPANVFLTSTGDVKLIDWSGGLPAADAPEAQRGRAATRAYASPQVLDGAWPQAADDRYSLAVVAAELLSGRHPFAGSDAAAWRDAGRRPRLGDDLPRHAAVALAQALAWDAADRPPSAADLMEGLEPEPPAPPVTRRTFESSLEVPPARPVVADEQSTQSVPKPPVAVSRRAVAVPMRVAPVDLAALRRPLILAAVLVIGALLLTFLFFGSEAPEPVASTGSMDGPAATEATESLEGRVPDAVAPASAEGPVEAVGIDVQPTEEPAPATTSPPIEDTAAQITVADRIASDAVPTGGALPLAEAAPAPAAPAPPARVTWVSFESADVVTSEAAVAAVLRVQRLERTAGRVQVNWRVVPDTATAGEDFEEGASGTAGFADGQSLRAIYVPLLPDRVFEGDERFVVELTSNRRDVRIGPIAKVTVTVRDDD